MIELDLGFDFQFVGIHFLYIRYLTNMVVKGIFQSNKYGKQSKTSFTRATASKLQTGCRYSHEFLFDVKGRARADNP